MLRVGNKIIQADIWDIVIELKQYFARNGITRFRSMQRKGNYIMCNCPNKSHKNGDEGHPSCGILRIDEENNKAGWVHCFTCGYSKKFDEMISDVMGLNDGGEFGRKWLLDNFVNYTDESRELNFDTDRSVEIIKQKYVSEEELDSYRWSHPYWAQRKIDEKTCIKFDLGYDKSTNSITMPVWDYKNRCIGVTKRTVHKKSFYIPEGVTKPVYLLNFAIKEGWKEIYLCESQINALYMNSLGYHACACFGTGTAQQAEDLVKSGVRSIVFCFDGDKAGRNGELKMYNKIKNRIICSYVETPDGKDMNDLTREEIEYLIKNQKYF